jgi:hypothetical protein
LWKLPLLLQYLSIAGGAVRVLVGGTWLAEDGGFWRTWSEQFLMNRTDYGQERYFIFVIMFRPPLFSHGQSA